MTELSGVLSILPVVGHPRDSKRISMILGEGISVKALAFERDYFAGRPPECEVVSLGLIANGRYLSRLVKIVLAVPKIRRHIEDGMVLYASGADMALMALAASLGRKAAVIVEVGDIRRVQVNDNVIGKLVRIMDRFVLKHCAGSVVTASGFESWYFQKVIGNTTSDCLLLENKLEAAPEAEHNGIATDRREPDLETMSITIGYFGVLRCAWSLEVLIALAKSAPNQIKIKIGGIATGTESLIEEATLLPNISYVGQYRSPEGLPELYSDVDLIWACYPPPSSDDRWRKAQLVCRSNRFYEGCRFRRPLISLRGSGDGVEIEKYNIGLLLDSQKASDIVSGFLDEIPRQLPVWKKNMAELPRNVFEYDQEPAQLKSLITRARQSIRV